STLIGYAGGFDADAYTRSLRVVRQNGQEYEVNTVKDLDYSVYKMRNGDVVTAEAILNRFTNKLEIRGAVYRPGIYQLNGRLNTVRELVNEAQGLTGDAFLNRAVLYRQREDLTTEVVPVDIKAIMDGTSPNIILTKNDILYIPSIHDLEDRGDVVIHGEVAKPDSYPYADNMTLEDLIIQAGGLREAASVVRVDVSRRIRNPHSTVDNDTIGKTYTFSLKEGFVVDGTPGFVLQPYDEVYVRRSPGYQAQQNVAVEGEILFEGSYAMTSRTERLSDLIRKAGGSTKNAYLRGAKLTRVATEGEKKRMEDVLRLMSRQLGEAMMDSLDIHVEDHFTVGIDLEKALANPGSTADIVLREGDVVFIPKSTNTVKINGAVMVPNTVSYISGKHIDYYLNQAGGYADNAKKSKKFIVYMNGQVTKVKGSGKKQIEPGCEIIVPSRSKKRTNMGEILGYATSFSSLGMMIASLANLIKK
ncbi:SLBB domain-containing protein, partial [Bacteroides caecimuris]|uniref:SLBB domain-containing protein n=1 Tax=Bacteroides caecimuris TaxID=1796613 RepID=UPI0026661ACF